MNISMKRKKKSFTMMELLVSMAIAAPIVATITATLIFAMRAQATYGDQSMIRYSTDAVLQRLAQDIRNTSASSYNSEVWQFPEPALQGEELSAPVMTLRLFDSTNGLRITWTFNRTGELENILTRTIVDLNDPLGTAIVTDYRKLPFTDLTFNEIELQEYQTTTDLSDQLDIGNASQQEQDNGFVYQSQWDNIDDTNNLTPFRVTAIEVRGRSLSRVSARNSLTNEVDANGDNDLRDDAVGARFFGRTDEGDDPSWQYIYNFEVAFRNS